MRLINIHTLELQWFGDCPPPYAILSHTWDKDELSLQSFQDSSKLQSPGFKKVSDFCRLVVRLSQRPDPDAERYGSSRLPNTSDISWAWVDTVCIDKTSSSELSEAINSMWRYYANSEYCVAYLSDAADNHPQTLRQSHWFSRGWTLQELLAPTHVLFYSQSWGLIGSRHDLAKKDSLLAEASGIESVFLEKYGTVYSASIAQRMSWAARRRTTRQEDMAYCLMGLFDVNMPLLYGEGWSKAFLRLQGEIIRQSDDESIFVFHKKSNIPFVGVLADHPAAFEYSNLIRTKRQVKRVPYVVTQQGLQIEGPAIRIKPAFGPDNFIIKLNCVHMLRRSSGRDRREPDVVRSCVLAVQNLGNVFVRRPQVEEQVLRMTSLEVEKLISRTEWQRIENQQFIIALTDQAALHALPSGVFPWNMNMYLERPRTRCVDAHSPWFEGVREEELNIKVDDVVDT